MKKFLSIVVLVFCILSFSARMWESRNDNLRSDEAAWIFSTVYLKHFSSFGWRNQDWRALDAYDHPPLAKYYYGLFLLPVGGPWKSIDDKTFWLNEGSRFSSDADFQQELSRKIPNEVLFSARVAATVSAALAACGVFALGSILFGPIAGAASVAFFSFVEIVSHFVSIVEADFLQLALLLFSLCFLIQWMRKGSRVFSMLAGIFLGLSFATKISAVVQLPAIFLGGALIVAGSAKKKKVLADFVLMIVAFILVSLVLNPTMLFSPIETLQKMFSHRAIQVDATKYIAGIDLISPVATTIAALQQIFVFMGLAVDKIFPLGLLLFCAGLVSIFTKINSVDKKFRPEVVVFILCAVLWLLAALGGFSTSLRIRYVLPAMPFVAIFCGVGVVAMVKLLSFSRELLRNKQLYLTLGMFGAMVLLLSNYEINKYIHIVSGSPEVARRKYEMLAAKNADLVSARFALMEISIAGQDYKSAIRFSDEAAGICARLGDQGRAAYFASISKVLSEQAGKVR